MKTDKYLQQDVFQHARPSKDLEGVIETVLRACSGSCLDNEDERVEVKKLLSVCIKAHFKLIVK